MTEQELKEIEDGLEDEDAGFYAVRQIPDLIAEIRRLQKEIEHTANTAAAIAKKNSEIAKQIADAPIVYGKNIRLWDYEQAENDTHAARLIDIKKLDHK